MMDLQVWKQRREELIREAQQIRAAQTVRESRKRRGGGRTSSLMWELRRATGRLRKLLRSSRQAG